MFEHIDAMIAGVKRCVAYAWLIVEYIAYQCATLMKNTVKPVYNDHLYNETYYLWFIQ